MDESLDIVYVVCPTCDTMRSIYSADLIPFDSQSYAICNKCQSKNFFHMKPSLDTWVFKVMSYSPWYHPVIVSMIVLVGLFYSFFWVMS